MVEVIQNAIFKALEDDRRNGTLIQGKLHFIGGERIKCEPAYLRTVIDSEFRKNEKDNIQGFEANEIDVI